MSKRNRYYWSLSIALYNLQSTIPDLLLALKESDSQDKAQQAAGFENVKKAVTDFQKTWSGSTKCLWTDTVYFLSGKLYS